MTTVGLYIDTRYSPKSGPYKVYHYLRLGLEKIGIKVLVNEHGDLTGCLHDNPQIMSLSTETLLGPNIFIKPSDRPELINRYHNILVPSVWVENVYRKDVGPNKRIVVWSVGIDTDMFAVGKTVTHDCLLYFKNRTDKELCAVQDMLNKYRQTHVLIKYGSYTENDFITCLESCRYAVILNNTESQGIGYMEILSTGTPCFVFNQTDWRGYPSTSVPYFDDRCGMISSLSDKYENDFSFFLNFLNSYCPRDYILENHTLKHGAERYLHFLEESK